MTSRRPFARRRLFAGLIPLVLVAAALPLMAPTCGGGEEGWRTFQRSSLIIPMDRCFQNQTDGVTPATVANCPAPQAGDVIKAYGLVYQLVRNDVPVYWVISPDKTALTGQDLAVQYSGGFPALKYDWTAGQPGAGIGTDHVVRYLGGPFIVDGSDYAKAVAVLQKYRTSFSGVNVHVSNVAFRGWVKKTMAGGWSAGGTVAPKLALLDIGSGNIKTTSPLAINDPKNAEPVISGYLAKAGIGSGTAAGTATGTHGEIYDRLTIEDFQPAAGSTDPKTSRLFTNGYQILWVPHWVAPGSCRDFSTATTCAATIYSQAQIDQTLRTIGAFVASGKDLFAECAGMGSFEGAFKAGNATATGYTLDYQDGDPSTRFQSLNGLRYNELPNSPFPAPSVPGNFSSPFLQLGDFPFSPLTGAIEDYRPQDAAAGGGYQADVSRLITGTRSTASPEAKTRYGDSYNLFDFYTIRPAASGHGTIVYLAGHSYSGVQGSFQVAGSRLVLNTLFNLGAGCTSSGVSCDTGKLGVCAKGVLTCSSGQSVCTQLTQASPEICNGLDDDCDGLVDEDLEVGCYGGPAGTQNVGLCRAGVSACERKPDGSYGMSACVGQVLPAEELCNGLDDNCNSQVDETLQQACYFGPAESLDDQGRPVGACKAGLQTCSQGTWGECAVCPAGIQPGDPAYPSCQILPVPETCQDTKDVDCNGFVRELAGECGSCTPGATATCYSGPGGTVNVGICHSGTQTCGASGAWGPCAGEQIPQTEVCTTAGGAPRDEDCDGQIDEGCACRDGDTEACYSGPAGTEGKGICAAGHRTCASGQFAGACQEQVLPRPETCNGQDDDCDGQVDNGATCAAGFACENGVCVPGTCGVENKCPEGYVCQGGSCKIGIGSCGGTTCALGKECQYGSCVDPCDDVRCAPGATCASGACVGGSCYYTGCPDGQLCREGECKADPCTGVACPSGTFCREGDCVQACAFVSCRSGEKCGVDGFCQSDPCAGKTCGPTQKCEAGSCVEDACLGLGCGLGQVCRTGVCVDDPCNGIDCPAGQCLDGQCYPAGNPEVVTTPTQHTGGTSSGCSTGTGAAGPLTALLLLAWPLARRRRSGGAGRLAALALAAVVVTGSACSSSSNGDTRPDLTRCGETGGVACEGEDHCIDVWSDPAHCGYCGNACGAGNVCVDKVCGPSSGVAPYVSAISPATGPKGAAAPVTVELTGQRFGQGASVRSTTPAGTHTYETTYVSPTTLRVQLDLSGSPATTSYLRVVNPDHVISNPVRFDITTPTPAITNLAPGNVQTGRVTDLTVTGTGFLAESTCRAQGPSMGAQALRTTANPDGTLTCTFDASSLPPATGYQLWVENPALPTPIVSQPRPLSVSSATPMVSDVSPSQAASGAPVAFSVDGDGFDITSRVRFDGTPITATTFISAHQLYVPQYLPPTCSSGSTCRHAITVSNGSGPESTTSASFYVGAPPPQITGLSPGSAYQGAIDVALTFQGSGFPSGTQLQLQPPGGAFRSPIAATVNAGATAVTAVVPSFADQPVGTSPEGTWLVRLVYPGPINSASYPFRLLSNQATLVGFGTTARGAAQGTTVQVTLSAVNLRPATNVATPDKGVRVVFADREWTPSAVTITQPSSGTGTVTVTLDATNLDTGTYAVQIKNPTAAPSNSLSFNVTPGMPTLASVSPPSAVQSDTPVVIVLTGTNFAKPDASGNGRSIVHVRSLALGITDFALPAEATKVVNPTRIEVTFDTRTGVPGTYDVSVWSPGGPTPPQKSDWLPGAFSIQ